MSPELEQLLAKHLPAPYVGKVRNSYSLSRIYEGRPLRLSVPTNRWSVYDFKLGFPNPGQAEMLAAFDIAAKLHLHKVAPYIETDLVAYGQGIDKFLDAHALHDNKELQRIGTIVEELDMSDPACECIGRNYATGQFYKAYKKANGGPVWGHEVPGGLPEGFKFARPIYTPSTKAKEGADVYLDVNEFTDEHGHELGDMTLDVLDICSELTEPRGVLTADIKIEIGRRKSVGRFSNGQKGRRVVGDELMTPHSTRFWPKAEYDAIYPRGIPVSMDKQIGREWGRTMGIDRLNPKDPAHRQAVLQMRAPPEILEKMRERSFLAFEMIYGKPLTQFQQQDMNVAP